jgi:hypothetical protein
MRKRLFHLQAKGLLLITGILAITIFTLIPIQAASDSTITTILPNKSVVKPGEAINFSIFVYSGFNPVPFGQLRLLDIETGESLDSSIINGSVVISWIITGSLGAHTFRATYQGFLDIFSQSIDECVVMSEDINPGTRETSLIITVNSTNVYKNASLHFNLALYIHYRYWFQGGYISVINDNLTGSPTILTFGPLENYYPGTDPAILNLEFDYQIPLFASVGKNLFYAEYTGSSASATAPCSSNIINIDVLSSGYLIVQSISTVEVQRSEETVIINTTIIGDNPLGLLVRVYYFNDLELIILSEIVLNSRNHITTFYPNNSVTLGPLVILTDLYNEQGTIYDNHSENIIIKDRAHIQYTLNGSEFNQNETIHLEVYITQEDVLTNPIDCYVELVDINDGNVSLSNKSTNINGFVIFDYLIPENSSIGGHKFGLRVSNIVNPHILKVMIEVIVPIMGLVELDLTYESGGISRGAYTNIQVTVLSGGGTLNEGFVELLNQNNTLIETQSCVAGLIFSLYIPNYHPLGTMSYLVHYFGSTQYDEIYKNLNLTIFSNPSIESLGQNSSEGIKGQSVRFWGYLLDEIGTPLYNQNIFISDLTTGEEKGFVITNDQGMFFYDYYISQSTQIGVHLFEFKFLGNIGNFFLSSINNPIISITIRPPLSIMVDESILADSWAEIRLEGGLMDIVSLSWQKDNESSWEYIADIQLNSSGLGSYNWSTPYYKGGISLRASSYNSTKYDHTFVYVIPDISVIASEIGNVNDNFQFSINCSERYQIWIEGQLWLDWNVAGLHSYEYIFENRGLKTITVISSDLFVYYNEFRFYLSIFEDIIIHLSVPSEAFPNIAVNIDGNIMGEVSGPISGLNAFLLVNGTEIEVDSSNTAGEFYFSLYFTQVGIYSIKVQTPKVVENFFSSSISNSVILRILSLPATIEIHCPENNSVHGSIIEVSLSGNAERYWYYIEPLDQINYTWTRTIYRTITEEGSFKCHVFAENQYNAVTHAFTYFSVDLTSPSLAILSPLNMSYKSNDVELSYLTDEEQLIVILDGISLGFKESGTNIVDLGEGTHNLTIQVKDPSENGIELTVLFTVDTILPLLSINSPFNRSYNGNVTLSFSSDASTVLYSLSGISDDNITYSTPVTMNLPLDDYRLIVYAFDKAGNVINKIVEFSIVESVNLLQNSQLHMIDQAGNYLVTTSMLSHPDFEEVGILLNGTRYGVLTWNFLFDEYQLNFQLPSPGKWEVLLFAKTTDDTYDFESYSVIWNPPKPEIIDFTAFWESSHYEIRVKIDSVSIPLETVQVKIQDVNYSCYYYAFTSEWRVQLNILPENYTVELNIWYSWDTLPSVQKEYILNWYVPILFVEEFEQNRSGFSFDLRVEKGNGSLRNEVPLLMIANETDYHEVYGTLIYKAVTGNYEIWSFSSPILPPGLWNFSVDVSDVYGVLNHFTALFNSTDIPPQIGKINVDLISNTSTGSLYRLVAVVIDDYGLIETTLLINGEKRSVYQINNTHYGVEFFLTEGTYAVQLSVTDDLNQQITQFVMNLHVVNNLTTSSSTIPTSTTSTPENTSLNTLEVLNVPTNDFVEIGFASGIFASLVALGNAITRRKRIV